MCDLQFTEGSSNLPSTTGSGAHGRDLSYYHGLGGGGGVRFEIFYFRIFLGGKILANIFFG